MTTITDRPQPTVADRPVPRRVRTAPWPYAGLVAGLAGAASSFFLAEGREIFEVKGDGNVSTSFVVDHLGSSVAQQIGAGLAVVAALAGLVFLVGLTRFATAFAPQRHTLLTMLQWSSAGLFATATVGASMRYISAGGHPDGIDHKAYTDEAIGTIAVLADQLCFAVYLPGLVVMGVVGLLAIRDRILPRVVGIAAVVLAGASTAATLAIGLPYSSGLVYPLFCLLIGAAAVASRKAQ